MKRRRVEVNRATTVEASYIDIPGVPTGVIPPFLNALKVTTKFFQIKKKEPFSIVDWDILCNNDNKNNNNNNDEDEDDSEVSHIRSFCFLHFDSIRNSRNIRAANDIAKKILLHVYSDDYNKRKRDSDSDSSNNDKPKVIQVETPQQRNGYDCGVHVLGAAKILSSSTTTTSLTIYSSNNDNNNSDSMNSVRLNLLEESLRQGVGNNSFEFCSKLRDEISSEILLLSSPASS
jgi:hypothetical protein